MLVSARGTLKPCLTNDCRHLAKWGEVHFIPTRADCFIMLSPLDKTMWVCTEGWFRGQIHSVIWCHFGCFCSLTRYLNFLLQRRGSGVHLFCSPPAPHAIVIAWAQVLFFLLHTFSLRPRAYFPLLEWVRDDNVKPHSAAESPPGTNSFYGERVKSRYTTETKEIRKKKKSGTELSLYVPLLWIQVHFHPQKGGKNQFVCNDKSYIYLNFPFIFLFLQFASSHQCLFFPHLKPQKVKV